MSAPPTSPRRRGLGVVAGALAVAAAGAATGYFLAGDREGSADTSRPLKTQPAQQLTDPRTSPATTAAPSTAPEAKAQPSSPLARRVDVYAAARAGMLSPVARQALPRVYVLNSGSNTVDVIDPRAYKIIDHFPVGALPQHAEVYALSTRTGRLLARIRVGAGPHRLSVWSQPGRYSLGHTGDMR